MAPAVVIATLLEMVRWIVRAVALAPFAYYLLAIYSARSFFVEQRKRGARADDFTPPVSILKPVRDLDHEAYENFSWGYLGLLLTYGLPWSLAAALLSRSAIAAAGCLGACLVLRFLMAWAVGIWGLKDPVLRRNWWLVPFRDALQFCVWLASFSSNRITWRGSEFVLCGDRMLAVGSRPAPY